MAGFDEPLAVWDARERGWPHGHEAKSRWLREQGLPADQMYRIEFLLTDTPSARIFCFALNKDGRKYLDPDKRSAAIEPPRIIALTGLPPRKLLEAT
jgi:hypothetical protein